MNTRSRRVATVVLVAAIGAAGCTATSTGSGSAAPTTTSAPKVTGSSTPSSTTPSPPTTIANPWRAYWTSVNPGSAIDFVTTHVGWRLDGQVWGPRLDDNLGSGVVDNGSAWPGTSIAETTDGGRTWTTILRVSTGIWGMDLVSQEVGFAVGVTALLRTTDGGAYWKQVSEPAGHPLVWADFATSELGYGLTTTGALVRTVDGVVELHGAGHNRHRCMLCLGSGRLRRRPLRCRLCHPRRRENVGRDRARPAPRGAVHWPLERSLV